MGMLSGWTGARNILTALAIAAASGTSHAAGWELLGLQGRRIETILPSQGYLYAGTDSGVFRRSMDGSVPWSPLGLRRCSVRALTVFHKDTLLAGTAGSDTSIYRTTDAGATWTPFEDGYGGDYGDPVLAMTRLTDFSDVLFATGTAVIARSHDRGRSWSPVWGDWGGMAMGMVFVNPDPNDPSHVWAGGENGIFWPWLFKSIDTGKTFQSLPVLSTGDNRCHDIAILPTDRDRAWVSMGGLVRETRNGGVDCETVFENNFYLYCIEIDPLRPANLYLSGLRYDEPLTLFISRDTGVSWVSVAAAVPAGVGALSMRLVTGPNSNTLYFGTSKGVYRYVDQVASCCTDSMGNIDGSPDGLVTMGDLTVLIDNLFITLTPLDCPDAANLDQSADGLVTMADMTVLIDHLFIMLTPLPACP